MKNSFLNSFKKSICLLVYKLGVLRALSYFRVKILRKPSLTVLCYHRITDDNYLLSPQCISPADFEQHLIFFKKHFDIIDLKDIKCFLDGKKLLRDTIALSFDDGYMDNYIHAYKILNEHNLKATFFISSTPLLTSTLYWIDQLAFALSNLSNIASENLNDFSDELADYLINFVSSDVINKKLIAKKIFLYLNSKSEADKSGYLSAIKTLATKPESNNLNSASSSVMTCEQALEMQENGHCIAAHSKSHARFSNLTSSELTDEIVDSITLFRNRGFVVNLFAYPFGKVSDIGLNLDLSKILLQQNVIDLAFSTEDKCIHKSNDRYFLPRKVMSAQTIPQINLKLEMMAWAKN